MANDEDRQKAEVALRVTDLLSDLVKDLLRRPNGLAILNGIDSGDLCLYMREGQIRVAAYKAADADDLFPDSPPPDWK